jgi:hypothetical protein
VTDLRDLRPGDIMFGPIDGPVGLGVGLGQILLGEGFRVGGLSVRHVGIVAEAARPEVDGYPGGAWVPPVLVQAMPGGAEAVGMTAHQHWTDRHAYVRLPEDYAGQAEDAAAVACVMVQQGVAYSWASYLALAAWRFGWRTDRLGRWIDRRKTSPEGLALPVEAICSVLVDQAWTLTGKQVMPRETHPQVVTPGALAGHLLTVDGAHWMRPRSWDA